jgi:platelet-activating factor acetylhydrolase IB subunit alpha
MLSYLQAAGMNDSFAALARETDMLDFDPSDPKDKYSGLLEKKWTSVIRLQKKACRLNAAHG